MSELNKQQLCAALSISEFTVRRVEQRGLPRDLSLGRAWVDAKFMDD